MWVRVLLAGRFPSSLFTKKKKITTTTTTTTFCVSRPRPTKLTAQNLTSNPVRPGASINTCRRRRLTIIPQTGAAKASAPQYKREQTNNTFDFWTTLFDQKVNIFQFIHFRFLLVCVIFKNDVHSTFPNHFLFFW